MRTSATRTRLLVLALLAGLTATGGSLLFEPPPPEQPKLLPNPLIRLATPIAQASEPVYQLPPVPPPPSTTTATHAPPPKPLPRPVKPRPVRPAAPPPPPPPPPAPPPLVIDFDFCFFVRFWYCLNGGAPCPRTWSTAPGCSR